MSDGNGTPVCSKYFSSQESITPAQVKYISLYKAGSSRFIALACCFVYLFLKLSYKNSRFQKLLYILFAGR